MVSDTCKVPTEKSYDREIGEKRSVPIGYAILLSVCAVVVAWGILRLWILPTINSEPSVATPGGVEAFVEEEATVAVQRACNAANRRLEVAAESFDASSPVRVFSAKATRVDRDDRGVSTFVDVVVKSGNTIIVVDVWVALESPTSVRGIKSNEWIIHVSPSVIKGPKGVALDQDIEWGKEWGELVNIFVNQYEPEMR